jgi:ribonuclease HII
MPGETHRTGPDFSHEEAALAAGHVRIAGLDEAGRGCLCGPVVAAAVRLDPTHIPVGLNDSKVLTALQRQRLYDRILVCADVAVGEASPAEIDSLNILRASHLAMLRALAGLGCPADFALVDGHLLPRGLPIPALAVVKGDGRVCSVAAASVVAKVTRDRIMVDLAQQYPGYGWERNAGYPTADHLAALGKLGITPLHRRSFRPVHNILYQEKSITP